MSGTSELRSAQDRLVIRDRRLYFESAESPARAPIAALVFAIAWIIVAALLRNWLHARSLKRYYTLDIRRLRENALHAAGYANS